jgi:hypothetical protein
VTAAALLSIGRCMRAKKPADILHVYRVLHKQSPPSSEVEAHVDPAWLLRNDRYDTITSTMLFDEAKEALKDLPDDSDGEEDIHDIVGDAIAANPQGFLDGEGSYDDDMLNAYSASDSDVSD